MKTSDNNDMVNMRLRPLGGNTAEAIPFKLVEMMSMSAHSFYNKITTLTGMPATAFIRCYRLKTAQRIMDDNKGKKGISVSEIAYLVGFNDPKYFTRCFVKEFGVQPRVYMNE